MILNKEVTADSSFIGACEAVLEAFGNCLVGVPVFLPCLYSLVCYSGYLGADKHGVILVNELHCVCVG